MKKELRKKLEENREEITSMYEAGLTTNKVSLLFGCSRETMGNYLRKWGVTMRPTGYRKYEYNDRYFENIDSHEKAYFLGFIAADGCVDGSVGGGLRINLQARDMSVLKSFQLALGHPKEPLVDSRGYALMVVHSSKLIEDLAQYGIVPRKTYSLDFPNVPEEFVNSFLLGYFDGDGSISKGPLSAGQYKGKKYARNYSQPHFRVAGRKEFLLGYQQELISSCGVSPTKLYDPKGSYAFELGYVGMTQCKRIYEFLYKDSHVWLERKRDKFKEVIGYGR
jgi:hypothetical protein